MSKYYNLRFRMPDSDEWGYMVVSGGYKEIMQDMKSLSSIGLVVETGDYYVDSQYPASLKEVVALGQEG